jgi:antitoxin component YwqK of YwqJK toxin-antitoxin module
MGSCSKPKEALYKKLGYHNDLLTDPDTKEPFTGIARESYPDGKPKAEYPIKAGRFHGSVREWWANGNKKAETEFQNGERVGKNTEWKEDGTLFHERVYDHDHIASEKNY